MSEVAQQVFERILIIKPSSPGDILHALPVLHKLRRHYPDAQIAWLVAEPFANLIEADPAIDEVIPFDRKRFGRMLRSPKIAREFFAFVRTLRSKKFDLVIDMQGLIRSGFLAFASGAKVRLGFANAREMAWMFYTHKITPTSTELHAVDKNLELVEPLGIDGECDDFEITIDDDDHQAATQLLKDVGFLPGQRYIVLVPATRWETKCWPIEHFGQLAHLLRERHHLDSVLVGGQADVELAEQAIKESGDTTKNLCGKTTLRQLAALIHKSAIVITADSTPMHLAAALHRPLVALFGPTSPQRTGPYGRQSDVLVGDVTCSPCYLRRMSKCKHEHACLQGVSVEEVANAVAARLAHAGAAARKPGNPKSEA